MISRRYTFTLPLLLLASCAPEDSFDESIGDVEYEIEARTTVNAEADATVAAQTPAVALGSETTLTSDGDPSRAAYLRFTVPATVGTVRAATLRLYVTNPTWNGPRVLATSASWSEATVTYANRPAPVGATLDDLGTVASGTWVELDVSDAVTGAGPVSFVLAPDSDDGLGVASREATSGRPELVIVGDTPSVAGGACPAFAAPVSLGARESLDLNEASGLQASLRNPGVYWSHDDSGDTHRAFALTASGRHLGIYDVVGAGFIDWEAMGLGHVDGEWRLFFGDIGGNVPRAQVQVYTVPEPTVSTTQAPVRASLGGTVRMDLVYPDAPHNAEGLFVDPVDDSIYIVTKNGRGYTQVFRKAAPHVAGTSTLTQVAALDFAAAPLETGDGTAGMLATAADISPDGREILIKTYASTFLWRRAPGTSVASALGGTPCAVRNSAGETVAFTADGSGYLMTDEATGSKMYFSARLP